MTSTCLGPVELMNALLKCSNPEVRRLHVFETETTVEITGRVSCYYLKQLAQETLRSAAAGRLILNRVEVAR
jgi:hypothetical protein